MIENLKNRIRAMNNAFQLWSRKKKWLLLCGILGILTVAFVISYMSREKLVPLYTELSPQEAGQIKSHLDGKGISSELSQGGKVISVPEEQVDALKVSLASEGIPKSGSIDYSFFGQNKGFGMTDNEFNVLEREATQTEIEKLIKNISGVDDAKVMISTPEKGVFVKQEKQQSSASVVLTLKPETKLDDGQVRSLYHLVSKSVPNLPTENIVISDQYFHSFSLDQGKQKGDLSQYEAQRNVKQEIEHDLQMRVQQMLSMLIGPNKVISTVTADIDFTKEKREEKRVEPVDTKKIEGIKLSAEKVRETFTGSQAKAKGIDGTGESDIPTYQGTDQAGGDSEKTEDRINYEVNRIHKEITKSPYTIRDLGIQVMVEPPKPNDPTSLPQGTIEDITQMLSNIVRTSIAKDAATKVGDNDISQKIFVSAKPFHKEEPVKAEEKTAIPLWMLISAGLLLLGVIIALILWRKRKRNEDEEDGWLDEEEQIETVQQEEKESDVQKAQLEKLAKDRPDEFAKLLRTWLSEE
ncbi:flagellar MS-ring protein [Fictibacillus macauensis ZFHKF-1]|uniref:Flagellar M-ring protein n=1 Tax=Fictibacillus macauensis ZFHKF-1 TaxID=1196324 RepID=I8UDU6_9BACL|nr:flagellar basal-body MS-ring/collar protein FliF [Fictibacillus macauensis]EIT85080.1 flagellar MS-ring protein [Fictibacillus macauensis ZFHKF-1]